MEELGHMSGWSSEELINCCQALIDSPIPSLKAKRTAFKSLVSSCVCPNQLLNIVAFSELLVEDACCEAFRYLCPDNKNISDSTTNSFGPCTKVPPKSTTIEKTVGKCLNMPMPDLALIDSSLKDECSLNFQSPSNFCGLRDICLESELHQSYSSSCSSANSSSDNVSNYCRNNDRGELPTGSRLPDKPWLCDFSSTIRGDSLPAGDVVNFGRDSCNHLKAIISESFTNAEIPLSACNAFSASQQNERRLQSTNRCAEMEHFSPSSSPNERGTEDLDFLIDSKNKPILPLCTEIEGKRVAGMSSLSPLRGNLRGAPIGSEGKSSSVPSASLAIAAQSFIEPSENITVSVNKKPESFQYFNDQFYKAKVSQCEFLSTSVLRERPLEEAKDVVVPIKEKLSNNSLFFNVKNDITVTNKSHVNVVTPPPSIFIMPGGKGKRSVRRKKGTYLPNGENCVKANNYEVKVNIKVDLLEKEPTRVSENVSPLVKNDLDGRESELFAILGRDFANENSSNISSLDSFDHLPPVICLGSSNTSCDPLNKRYSNLYHASPALVSDDVILDESDNCITISNCDSSDSFISKDRPSLDLSEPRNLGALFPTTNADCYSNDIPSNLVLKQCQKYSAVGTISGRVARDDSYTVEKINSHEYRYKFLVGHVCFLVDRNTRELPLYSKEALSSLMKHDSLSWNLATSGRHWSIGSLEKDQSLFIYYTKDMSDYTMFEAKNNLENRSKCDLISKLDGFAVASSENYYVKNLIPVFSSKMSCDPNNKDSSVTSGESKEFKITDCGQDITSCVKLRPKKRNKNENKRKSAACDVKMYRTYDDSFYPSEEAESYIKDSRGNRSIKLCGVFLHPSVNYENQKIFNAKRHSFDLAYIGGVAPSICSNESNVSISCDNNNLSATIARPSSDLLMADNSCLEIAVSETTPVPAFEDTQPADNSQSEQPTFNFPVEECLFIDKSDESNSLITEIESGILRELSDYHQLDICDTVSATCSVPILREASPAISVTILSETNDILCSKPNSTKADFVPLSLNANVSNSLMTTDSSTILVLPSPSYLSSMCSVTQATPSTAKMSVLPILPSFEDKWPTLSSSLSKRNSFSHTSREARSLFKEPSLIQSKVSDFERINRDLKSKHNPLNRSTTDSNLLKKASQNKKKEINIGAFDAPKHQTAQASKLYQTKFPLDIICQGRLKEKKLKVSLHEKEAEASVALEECPPGGPQRQKKSYPTVRSKSICDNIMFQKVQVKKPSEIIDSLEGANNMQSSSEDGVLKPEKPSLQSQKKKIKLDDTFEKPELTTTTLPCVNVAKSNEIKFSNLNTDYSSISNEIVSTDNFLSSVLPSIITSFTPLYSDTSDLSFTGPEILFSSAHSFQKENSPVSLVSAVLQSTSKMTRETTTERPNLSLSLPINSLPNQRILEDSNLEFTDCSNPKNDLTVMTNPASNVSTVYCDSLIGDVPNCALPIQSPLRATTSADEVNITLPKCISSFSRSKVENPIPVSFFLPPLENSGESVDSQFPSENPKRFSSVAMVTHCEARGRERKAKSCDEGKKQREDFNVKAVSTGSKSFVYRVTSYKEFGDANAGSSVHVDRRGSNGETKPIFTSYKELHPVVDDSVQLISYKDSGKGISYKEYDPSFNKVTNYLEINPVLQVAEDNVKLISYKEFMPDFEYEHSSKMDSQFRPSCAFDREERGDSILGQNFFSDKDGNSLAVQKSARKNELVSNNFLDKKMTLQANLVMSAIPGKSIYNQGNKVNLNLENSRNYKCPLICESCSKIDQFADELVSSIMNIENLFSLIILKSKKTKNRESNQLKNEEHDRPQKIASDRAVCSVSMPEHITPVSFVVEEVFDFVDDSSSSDEYEDPETTLDESFKSLDIETLEIPSLTTPGSFNSTGSIVTVVDNTTPTPSPLPLPLDYMAPSPTHSLQRPNFLTNVTFLSRTPSPQTILLSSSRSSDNKLEGHNSSPDEVSLRSCYAMSSSLEIPVSSRPDDRDKTPTPTLNFVEELYYCHSFDDQAQGKENKEFLAAIDGRTPPPEASRNKVLVSYSEEEGQSASSFDGTSEDKELLLASVSASSTGSGFSWSPSQGPVARRDLLPLEDDDEPRPSWQALLAVNRPDSDDEKNGYESDDDFESMDVEMRRLEEKLKKFEMELGIGNLSFEKTKTDSKAFSRPRLRPEDIDILKTFSLPQVYPPVNIAKTKHYSLMNKTALALYEDCEDDSVRSSFRGSSMESGSAIFVKAKRKLKKGDRCCRSLDLQKLNQNQKRNKFSNSKLNLTNKTDVSDLLEDLHLQGETDSQYSYYQVQDAIDNTTKIFDNILDGENLSVEAFENIGDKILPTTESLGQTVSTDHILPSKEFSVPSNHSIEQGPNSRQSSEHPNHLFEYSEQLYIGYLWHEESSGMTAVDFDGLDDINLKDVENSLMFIFEDDDVEDTTYEYYPCTTGNLGDSDLSLYHSTDSKIKTLEQQKKPDSLVSAFKNSFKKAAKYLGPINFSKNIKEESKEQDEDLNFDLKSPDVKGSETGKYHVPTARIHNDGKSDTDYEADSSLYSSGEYYASPAVCIITTSSEDDQPAFEVSNNSVVDRLTHSPSAVNYTQRKFDDKVSINSEYSCWYDSLTEQRKVNEVIGSPKKDTVFCVTGFSSPDDERPLQTTSRGHSPLNQGKITYSHEKELCFCDLPAQIDPDSDINNEIYNFSKDLGAPEMMTHKPTSLKQLKRKQKERIDNQMAENDDSGCTFCMGIPRRRSDQPSSHIRLPSPHPKVLPERRTWPPRARSEEQVATTRAWLDAERVWLVHKGGFCAGRQLRETEEGESLPEGRVRIKLEHNNDVIEVEEDDVEKANPAMFDRCEDLAHLRYLNESSILNTLRQRYGSNLIHTYAGSAMVVLNPTTPLAIYSEKVIQMFKGCKLEDMPPHIYSVAQSTYREMIATRRDQSIIFLGRSGGGKTTNFRHVLHYLALAAGATNKILTVEKLNAISTLLEAFGNSRTVLNTNATRFTQIFSLDFDRSGQIGSASVQVYMPEKMRVVRRPDGEPNYHIFYQLLSGADEDLRNYLGLDNLSQPNLFMTPLQRNEDKQRAGIAWARIRAALEVLKVSEDEQKALWSVLASVYHLGTAGSVRVGNSNKFQFGKPGSAQKAAFLLGTSVEELARAIFASSTISSRSTIRSVRETEDTFDDIVDLIHLSGSNRTASPTERAFEKPEGADALEGMASGLYTEAFNAVVALINRCISTSAHTANSILVLDSPGFQNPASCGRVSGASFSDLCHNYCQERLQMLFHDVTFTAQTDRYAQEHIECSDVTDELGTPAPLISILDKTSSSSVVRTSQMDLREADRRGLMWLLDEEAIFPGASDSSFLQRLFTHYGDREYSSLIYKESKSDEFTLNHFQGTNPVTYSTQGWLKSSRENPVCRHAAALLQESNKESLSRVFVFSRGPVSNTISGSAVGIEGTQSLRRASSIRRAFTTGTASIKRKSVCLQVKFTVDGIVDTLRRSKLKFVHCLLPQHNAGLCDLKGAVTSLNKNSTEDSLMNVPLLRSQIRGCQILDALRIHKQGFPEHLQYSEFRRRFTVLAPSDSRPQLPVSDEKVAVESILTHLELDASSYRLGLSQIFFRTGTISRLEEQRDLVLTDTVVRLQAVCRGILARRRLQKRKVQETAIKCIQKNVRKFMAVRDWPWWRLLVRVTPLLNVHRTEEELRSTKEELDTFKTRLEKLEKERNDLKHENNRLETRLSSMDVGGGGCSRTSIGPRRLEDLSSGSDDEYFDVHPLPGYFCVPSPKVSQDCQIKSHGGQTHVAPNNGPVKHSLIIGPSWKRTPLHSQSLPAVNKILCPAKMGNVNIPPPVSEASQEMQPLRTHKKYPAPPPPVSREPSFVSIDSLNSRNSLYGSQNAQLGICLSTSGVSVNTIDSVSPRKKPHRSPSLKKYPAPQPPVNSPGDTVTFKTNSLPRNHYWRNYCNTEITEFNNSITKTISENPIPEINPGIKRPGSPLPNSSTTLPVRLKPNSPSTRTTPFIGISKHNHLPTTDHVSSTSFSPPLPTECPTVDSKCIGYEGNVKFATSIKSAECESNLAIPEKITIQLLEDNSHIDIIEDNISPCSDCLATPINIGGNVKYESENNNCDTSAYAIEIGLPICNDVKDEEKELKLINKNQSNSESKQDVSNVIEHLENFDVSPEVDKISSEKHSQEIFLPNQGLELSNCKDQENKNKLFNMRIGEAAKKDAINNISVTDKIENSKDTVTYKESIEDCDDKSTSNCKSSVIKESLNVRDIKSQSRQGSVSKDSISSRGSRETSVSSTSSDNIDQLSRNTTDRFFIKRSKSGKLAALASKFESEEKTGVAATPLKSNMSKNSGKFARNKIAGLANIFVGDSQNKDSNKMQSPYSKPFSPESSISEKVKTNIGGIDVSKFGEVATNIKDFRPHKKVKDEVRSPTSQNESKSKTIQEGKINIKSDQICKFEDEEHKLKGDISKLKEVGKNKLKEKNNFILTNGVEKILNGECMESKSKDTVESKTQNENKYKEQSSLKNMSSLKASTPLLIENETANKKEEDVNLAKRKKKKRPPKDATLPVNLENDKTNAGDVEISSVKGDLPKSIPNDIEKENTATKSGDISSMKEVNVDLKSVTDKLQNGKTSTKSADICTLKETNILVSAKIDIKMSATNTVEICSVKETNVDLTSVPAKLENKNTTTKSPNIWTLKEIKNVVSAKKDKEKTAASNVEVCSVKETNVGVDLTSVPAKSENQNATTKSPDICSLKETKFIVSEKKDKEKTTTSNVEVCSVKEKNIDLSSVPVKLENVKTASKIVDIYSLKESNVDHPKTVSASSDKEICCLNEKTNVGLLKSDQIIVDKKNTILGGVEICSSTTTKIGFSLPIVNLDGNCSVIKQESFKNDGSDVQDTNAIVIVKPLSDEDKSVESGSIEKNSLLTLQQADPSVISSENFTTSKVQQAEAQKLTNCAISNSPSLLLSDSVQELTIAKVLEKSVDLTETDESHHLSELTSNETKESDISGLQIKASPFIPINEDSYAMGADLKSSIVKPSDLVLENDRTSVQTNSSVSFSSSSSLSNEKPFDSSLNKLTDDGSGAVLNMSKVSMLVVDKLTSFDAIHNILQAEFRSPKSEDLQQNCEPSIPVVLCSTTVTLEPIPAVKIADALSQSVLNDVSVQMNQISTRKSIPFIDSNIIPDIPVATECVEKLRVGPTTTSAVVSSRETSLSSAAVVNDKPTGVMADTKNNFTLTETEKKSDKLEIPVALLSNENIQVLENNCNSKSVLAMEIENLQQPIMSIITNDQKNFPSSNFVVNPSPVESFSPTYIQVSTEQLLFPSKVDTDICINKNVNMGMLEDTAESSVGLFQGMVNSLKTSFSKVMLHASSNSINIDNQHDVAIVDKKDTLPERVTDGSSLETFVTENNCFMSPNSSSPEYHSVSSSTHTVNSVEIDLIKNDFVNDKKIIVGSETGARSKRPSRSSNVSMPEEVLNVSEILREAEERLTKALEKDPLVYRFPIGKVDDVYVDAFDPSQFDILMPLPTSEDRMLLDRRSRSSTPYREGLDRRSPTPNRIVEQTEALLSETDRILRKSRSHNSLRRSFTRSLSGMNLSRLSEVTADLAEEHSTSHLAGERIEAEQAERMRLEKEVNDLQSEVKLMTDTNDKLEMERLALKTEMLHVELNGDIHDSDDAADAALYKRKYEWSLRELEVVKKQLKQQQEDDLDQLLILKKQLEKKICDSHEETEEQRQVATQLKKKSQRLQAEMNDMKILLEEQSSRNNLLEKKQRKFDQDVHVIQEELRNEKLAKDKMQREKDQTLSEKYSFEQEVAALKLELDLKEEKVTSLTREINDLNFTGKAEEEVAILKKAKHDLELRVKDQEEELDDLAGQVQMLESARLRLEMSIEQMRKENRKEAQLREEEMEEVRVAAQKKVKAFEAQLESEHDERTQLMREKHELERRLAVVQERTFATVDEDAFHKVKKELKKTKALLKDTQTMLEKTQSEGSNKLLLRQLKTQLEDAEFAKTAAIKARQSAESEAAEIQSQLEEALRTKNDAEERCMRHIKEKTEMQTQLEEGEEEVAEVMKKYKATVSQLSIDQINISEQAQMIAELEHEKQVLQERLTELSSKVEVLEGETANIHTQRRLQMKIKELESKLELESTTRQRLESQITRLKDQVERLCSECDSAKSKETQTQDFCKKLNRQLREAKEDLSNIQQKHTDATGKKQEIEKQLELAESEIITLKSDLKLAFKRIEDLQQALQGDLSDSDTELTDSDSESETSLTTYLTASATQDRPLSNSTAQTTENESPSESKIMELMVCSPTADLMSSIREDMEDDYKESFA